MNNEEKYPEAQLVGALTETRRRLDAIEAGWKEERAVSRRLTCQLITHYGWSILKASNLSGHQRGTIMAWLASDGIQGKG